MKIVFEKIIPTTEQIEKLYLLLKSRKYGISHNRLPSTREHKKFVIENPYLQWYILSRNENLLGSVYLQSDNSIGINLIQPNKDDLLEIIKHIKANHHPLPSINSFRRGEFFLNVASENLILIKVLKKLNAHEIQRSFVI